VLVDVVKLAEKHYSIDVKGYACPYPLLATLSSLARLETGGVLEVILDNPPSSEDIPAAARKRGHRVIEVLRVSEDVWKITIQKVGEAIE